MSEIRDMIEARLRGERLPGSPSLTLVVDRGKLAAERATMLARVVDPVACNVVIDRRERKDRRVSFDRRYNGQRKGQRRDPGSPFAFTVRVGAS